MPEPIDLSKLKAACRASNISRRIVSSKADGHAEDLFTMVLALSAAVKKVFYEKSETKFSDEPVIDKKLITQFVKRMRVDGMEKFNTTTMLSVVHFYTDANALSSGVAPVGLIIVYVERSFVPEILRLLKYPYINHEDDDDVRDGIGAIVNLVAGSFKKELSKLGYADLEMSHFKSYENTTVDGIEYPSDQQNRYEISFDIDERKRIVIEMIMAPIAKIE